jgi:hypothetical protein
LDKRSCIFYLFISFAFAFAFATHAHEMEDRTAVPAQLIRPDVGTLKYSPVQSLESIALEVGLRVEDLIKMDANENAYGTPDEVKQAIIDAFSKLHIYPGTLFPPPTVAFRRFRSFMSFF